MWFVRLPLVLVCIGWPVVVGAQNAPATGQTVTAPGGVAVGRDIKNSPITVYNMTYEIDFNKPREQFKETATRVAYGEPGNIPRPKGKGAIACYSHS